MVHAAVVLLQLSQQAHGAKGRVAACNSMLKRQVVAPCMCSALPRSQNCKHEAKWVCTEAKGGDLPHSAKLGLQPYNRCKLSSAHLQCAKQLRKLRKSDRTC